MPSTTADIRGFHARSSTAQHSTAQHSTAQATVTVISQVSPDLYHSMGNMLQQQWQSRNAEPDLKSPVGAASSASCLDGAFPHATIELGQTWQAPLVALQLLIQPAPHHTLLLRRPRSSHVQHAQLSVSCQTGNRPVTTALTGQDQLCELSRCKPCFRSVQGTASIQGRIMLS